MTYKDTSLLKGPRIAPPLALHSVRTVSRSQPRDSGPLQGVVRSSRLGTTLTPKSRTPHGLREARYSVPRKSFFLLAQCPCSARNRAAGREPEGTQRVLSRLHHPVSASYRLCKAATPLPYGEWFVVRGGDQSSTALHPTHQLGTGTTYHNSPRSRISSNPRTALDFRGAWHSVMNSRTSMGEKLISFLE
jgi:hypothetical protein